MIIVIRPIRATKLKWWTFLIATLLLGFDILDTYCSLILDNTSTMHFKLDSSLKETPLQSVDRGFLQSFGNF